MRIYVNSKLHTGYDDMITANRDFISAQDCWDIEDASFMITAFYPEDHNNGENEDSQNIARERLRSSVISGRLKPDYNKDGIDYFKPSTIGAWNQGSSADADNVNSAAHTHTHSTKLLEILHHCITDNWEGHDPKNPPTNDLIKQWCNDYYPETTELSGKVKDAMCTIMRPPKYK